MGSADEHVDFEDALKELEETVAKLEMGNLSLEESLLLYEKGQKLAELCNTQLQEASMRVERLTSDGDTKPLNA